MYHEEEETTDFAVDLILTAVEVDNIILGLELSQQADTRNEADLMRIYRDSILDRFRTIRSAMNLGTAGVKRIGKIDSSRLNWR